MRIRTIVTYQAHCDVCGHGTGPQCATVEEARRFVGPHKRTNYHKRNESRLAAMLPR